MEWITENWTIVVSLLCMLVCLVDAFYTFIKEPKDTKIANVKEWLLWAVTECEKQLGTGTGTLKLRLCWDMACKTFPWISKVVPFETFSKWVDEALAWMKVQLECNQAVQTYVEGEKTDVSN